MNRGMVVEALRELEEHGAKLTVEDGDRIRVSYRCPVQAIPAIKSAVAILREHKQEAIDCLAGMKPADESRRLNWPVESVNAEQRFGCFEARLYPFLEQQVRTPLGAGKLLQVLKDRATVLLDGELKKPRAEQRASVFKPSDVCPVHLM